MNEQSINKLVDPTDNSANEQISRIRSNFKKALVNYQCDAEMFIPVGQKGEKYRITIDRSCIRWKPMTVSIFNNLISN